MWLVTVADLYENFLPYRDVEEDDACLLFDEIPLFFKFLTIPPPPIIEAAAALDGIGLLAVVEASSPVKSTPGPAVMFRKRFDYYGSLYE